jgi:DNA ligase (NAD+)
VALGVPDLGEATARAVARTFGTIGAVASATPEALSDVPGIDLPTAGPIAAWFRERRHQDLIARLVAAGVRFVPEAPVAVSAPLSGKTIVLTGTLQNLTRPQATQRIIAAGGTVAGSVSRRTHYVVAGADAGSKLDRANELGIPVISEADLADLLGRSDGPEGSG